jgi:hypothetical protein
MASGRGDPASQPPLDGCAAVFVLSPEAVGDDSLAYAAYSALERCETRDDFRIYVILDGLSPVEFYGFASQGLPLFVHLQESVQLVANLGELETEDALTEYLAILRDVQDRAKRRRLVIGGSMVAARTAQAIQMVLPLVAFSAWLRGAAYASKRPARRPPNKDVNSRAYQAEIEIGCKILRRQSGDIARLTVLQIPAMEIPAIRGRGVTVILDGSGELESGRVETQRQASTASEQVKYSGATAARQPGDLLADHGVRGFHRCP